MAKTKTILLTIAVLCLVTFLCVNRQSFRLQTERCLVPPLKSGMVLVQRSERVKDTFSGVDDVGILKGLDVEFLPNFKNPCWYEVQRDSIKLSRSSKPSTTEAKPTQDKHNPTNPPPVLHCLPYFFLIGQPKCATTDIFRRISCHPDVAEPIRKGPNWWTRRRFGMPYSAQPSPFHEYTRMFNASKIQESAWGSNEVLRGSWEYQRITGDGSTSTLWDSSQTMTYLHHLITKHKHRNVTSRLLAARRKTITFQDIKRTSKMRVNTYELIMNGTDQLSTGQRGVVLPFTVADTIHLVLPKARVIAVFREPVSRLYSSYLFFTKKAQLSPHHFDEGVRSSMEKWNSCIKQYSDRTCAYNKTLQNSMSVRIYNGLYNIYIKDWLKVFPREQLLVIRMEDYQKNINKTLEDIYYHLGLRSPSAEESKLMNINKVYNKNQKKYSVGKMLESTRKILEDFYKPYNKKLATILNNSKYEWEDYKKKSGSR